MKYYVVSDVHGFYDELMVTLTEKGFFKDAEPHKLIVCGDMMDRGKQAVEMQNFMMELFKRDELIFVRGNHEDLMCDMLMDLRYQDEREEIAWGYSHHVSNGTYDTALQLSGMKDSEVFQKIAEFIFKVENCDFYKVLMRNSVNYFETNEYVFVHGWIPCKTNDLPAYYRRGRTYEYNPDWRNASQKEWGAARWFNGMELCELRDIRERGKTIVVGHWNSSWGHCHLEGKCTEWGNDAIFTPYTSKGIMAIDACTAFSGFVNCLVIED
jgi:serine/threonine protein phosphatase 1